MMAADIILGLLFVGGIAFFVGFVSSLDSQMKWTR